jgi:hypothetical protein
LDTYAGSEPNQVCAITTSFSDFVVSLALYLCGDANSDETVKISDAVWIINYVFVEGNDPCDTEGDGVPDC